MRIKSISHAGVTVTDFDRSVTWYHETFGFYLVSESRLGLKETARLEALYGVKNATLRFGFLRAPNGMVLEIFCFEPQAASRATASWNAPGFTHIAFDVSHAERWKKLLESQGVVFVTDVNETDGTKWVFLKDPDGNLIELIDLGILRFVVKTLGGLVGRILKGKKFKEIYGSEKNF